MVVNVLWIIGAYLYRAVPVVYLIGRLRGVDLSKEEDMHISLWRKVGPLDPTFYFAMDYDLWVRLARVGPLVYTPRLWANFRLHGAGKSVVSDERCWPEMLRVHQRDGGGPLSVLYLKAKLRTLVYAWLPLRMRLWLRRRLPV